MKVDAAKPVKTAKVKKPFNIWRMTLILLAVVVLSVYIVSWIAAKFVSKQDSGDAARVASFSCSAVIDDVSALSFTNTAFWSGEHTDRVAMNALRTLHVVVRNWEEVDGEKRIAEVPTSYDLQFTAPANFVEKLAVQFADHVEHHGDHVVLPQIDIEAVIAAAKEGKQYNTAEGEDYGSVGGTEIIFDTGTYTTAEGKEAYRIWDSGSGDMEIRIEPLVMEMERLLYFRVWDTSGRTSPANPTVSDEGGTLLSPLEVRYTEQVNCYKFSYHHPSFVFDAGVEQENCYTISMTPKNAIHDHQLGGFLVGRDENSTPEEPSFHLYQGIDKLDDLYTMTINGELTDVYPDGTTEVHHHTMVSSAKDFVAGETITENPEIVREQTKDQEPISGGVYLYYTRSGNTYTFADISTENLTNYEYRIFVNTATLSETVTTTTLETIKTNSIDWGKMEPEPNQPEGVYSQWETLDQDVTKTTTVKIDRVYQIDTASITYQNWYGNNWTSSTRWNSNLTNFRNNVPVANIPISHHDTDSNVSEAIAIDRTLRRQYHYVKCPGVISSVRRQVGMGADNQPVYEVYDNHTFHLFVEENGVKVQKFFLSQCYSKNYPFVGNVRFEQRR